MRYFYQIFRLIFFCICIYILQCITYICLIYLLHMFSSVISICWVTFFYPFVNSTVSVPLIGLPIIRVHFHKL